MTDLVDPEASAEAMDAYERAMRNHKGEWIELRPVTLRALLDRLSAPPSDQEIEEVARVLHSMAMPNNWPPLERCGKPYKNAVRRKATAVLSAFLQMRNKGEG